MNNPTDSDEEFHDASSSWLDHRVIRNALRPVTIRQLLDAERIHSDAKFTINGQEIEKIILVAHLLSVRERSESQMEYRLNDGTGEIIGKQWINDPPIELSESDVDGTQYIRVIGSLTKWKDRHSLDISTAHFIAHPLEVQFHVLQAMQATLWYNCGPPPSSDAVKKRSSKSIGASPARLPASPSYARPGVDADGDVSMSTVPERFVSGQSSSEHSSANHNETHQAVSATRQMPSDQPAQVTEEISRRPLRSTIANSTPRGPNLERVTTPNREVNTGNPSTSPVAVQNQRMYESRVPTNTRDNTGADSPPQIRRDPYSHLSAIQRSILVRIHEGRSNSRDVSIKSIARAVGRSGHDVEPQAIIDAIDHLLQHNYICLGNDDKHFKIVDIDLPRGVIS